MCGITGFLGGSDREHERLELLRSMTDAIHHRGPDGSGHHVDGPVSLGMRRLAIIDRSGGDQPIFNEDRSLVAVFNGEIYNFRELRTELETRGHTFATASDTEVIVHLFEECGTDAFSRLDGMFAVAIWDTRSQELVIARDRFGKKPLFYSTADDGTFLFGSELKSMHRHPSMHRRVDVESLAEFLVHECVPSPGALFDGVHKLDGGHWLRVRAGARDVEVRSYYQLTYEKQVAPPPYATAVLELRERLQTSVRARLVAEVPLGVFLSGGIDSSAIAALAVRSGVTDMQTFSIAFEEESFDESTHARSVASHLGTDHHEHLVRADDMLDLVPRLAEWTDEPIADPSILPTFVLSQFARERVTVALGGDGGDEVFAGYPTYTAHRAARGYSALPAAIRRGLIEPAVRKLPASDRNFSFEFKAKRFISGTNLDLPQRHATWMSGNHPATVRELLAPDVRHHLADIDLLESARRRDSEIESTDWIDRVRYQDLSRYLRDVVLVKVDRASMAASLEVRAPFLDHHLVEWVASLPSEYVFHRGTTKRILKDAVRGLLPPGIVDRPKKGFGIPLAAWLKGALEPLARDLLAPEHLARQGLFDPTRVTGLLDAHVSGAADNRKQLWPILVFQLWHERWAGPADRDLSPQRRPIAH